MSTMPTLDDDVFGPNADPEMRDYGAPNPYPWRSPMMWDGDMPICPRRPEVLDDAARAVWFADLEAWATWAIGRFRIAKHFPPCWPQHGGLVEELLALWLVWQAAWLPATDALAPIGFLRELDWSIGRVERLWRLSCTPSEHKTQVEVAAGAVGPYEIHPWWNNPSYPEGGFST